MDSRLLKFLEKLPPELKPVLLEFYELLGKELGERLTREEFREFYRQFLEDRNRFEAFAERTEENFRRVWETIERLTKEQEAFRKEVREEFKRVWEAIDHLAERVNWLTERLERLTERVDQLTERMDRLTEQVEKLTRGLSRTREELGSLSRTMAYALKNEAYRYLPAFLEKNHGIKVRERFVRTYLDGEEMDLFGKVQKDVKEMYLVGEAVLRLDDREKLRCGWRKVEIVREEFGGEALPVIVTHTARPEVLKKAGKAGILVVQSFEWWE